MSEDRTADPRAEQELPERGVAVTDHYLRVIKDVYGRLWICPDGVDEHQDLASQGCWRSGDSTIDSTALRLWEQVKRTESDEIDDEAHRISPEEQT